MEPFPTAVEGPTAWTLPRWGWLLGIAALLAWHGWLTLSLFGEYPWADLHNDQPIVNGAHPQHLYLAKIGVRSMVGLSRTVVFDLAFQGGYPITPIFDGARIAEFFLLFGGGTYQPAAYKIGLAALCMSVPILLLIAARSLGVGNFTSLLATLLGLLIWWGPHGRSALVTGDFALYLASLVTLAHFGLLISFHRTARVSAWFGLWLTGCVGWFLQPLFLPIVLPVLLVYYLSVGVKHDFLSWHIAFWSAEILGVLLNLPWLSEWIDSWWLRTPLPIATDLLEHRTFVTVWNAPLWGGSTSRVLAILVTVSALAGAVILNQTRQRPAARILGLASGGCLILALLGISWEPLGAVGTAALLAPALWFACIPAAHAWTWSCAWLWRRGALGRCVLIALFGGAGLAFTLWADTPMTLLDRCFPGEPLEIGLGPAREALVQTIIESTHDDARILWEDRSRPRQASRWSALLPILTERSFIGGLDPDGFIEHSSISLIKEVLEGRPISTWSDDGLLDYSRRYNIRWIVAWSPGVIRRLEDWPLATKRTAVYDEGKGWLFEVARVPNFALRGHAELVEATGQYLMLSNVVPVDGEVVISLHYQTGMRASPGRVQVERAKTGEDAIDFVRLRLAVWAPRITLTWDR